MRKSGGGLMKQSIVSLATERLRIDPLVMEDVTDFLALYGDEGVMRYLPVPPLQDVTEAGALLSKFVERMAAGEQFRWAIRTRDDDRVIGALKLDKPFDPSRSSEVGYMLVKEAWGKGYALEATSALIDYAFNVLGRHRLEALIYAENTPSRKLVERLGFRLEGYFLEHDWKDGRYWDDTTYGLLAQEWAARRSIPALRDRSPIVGGASTPDKRAGP
jgi:ribosomal-protein-alanine N-acetyltransferase